MFEIDLFWNMARTALGKPQAPGAHQANARQEWRYYAGRALAEIFI